MLAAQEAEAKDVPVCGIKGTSVLASTLDLVDGIPIDYMHAVLEGVTKWLLHAWFKSQNHREAFYFGRSMKQINLLPKQRPPSEFSRPPRSIQGDLSYWKASELRNWLLFYSLPLLLGCLPPLYLHHYALLVCALHVLLKESNCNSQIDAAEAMLSDFVTLLPELYGEMSCTANSHMLTHLPKYVRLWGPLWTHSAFGFESKNGHLKHLYHSRADIVDQLVFNIDVQQTLQLLHPELQQKASTETLDFLSAMNGNTPRRGMKFIENHTYSVGRVIQKHLTVAEYRAIGIVGASSQVPVFLTSYLKGQGKRMTRCATLQLIVDISLGRFNTLHTPHPCGHC